MGCFLGCLMTSASDQKLFCEVCSAFNCSFDEFVGEKVVSLSYSSAILAPPIYFYFNWRLITLEYSFTWISHGCTCVPHPDPPSHVPPHLIPQGHPSAPALSTLPHASNLDWWSVSHMIIYMFHCYSLKSSLPRLLPQSPTVCSLHLCLFFCLTYRVIITIFLNSTYMH